MKVMCINDTGWHDEITGHSAIGPDYMETCTVIREFSSQTTKGKYYDLQEYPPINDDDGFCIQAFIPLSTIDELELVNEREETVTA